MEPLDLVTTLNISKNMKQFWYEGKTYIVSKVVKEVRGWLGTESPIVVARVLGTSPDSSSLQVMNVLK